MHLRSLFFCLIVSCACAAHAQMLHPGYGTMGAPMSNFLSNGYLTQQVTNDLVFGSKGERNSATVKSNHITVQRTAPVMPKKLAAGYPANARAEAERVFAKLLELCASRKAVRPSGQRSWRRRGLVSGGELRGLPNPGVDDAQQITANMRQAAKGYLEQFLKTGAEQVDITTNGLVIKGKG
jgi:hypothetical protein